MMYVKDTYKCTNDVLAEYMFISKLDAEKVSSPRITQRRKNYLEALAFLFEDLRE